MSTGLKSSTWKPPADALPGKWSRLKVQDWQHPAGAGRTGSGRVVYEAIDDTTGAKFVVQFCSRPSKTSVDSAGEDRIDQSSVDVTGETVLSIAAGETVPTDPAIELLQATAAPPQRWPDRFVLDLSAFESEDWRPAVIVTRLGSDVGEYRIADFAGIGGMGEAWFAWDMSAQPVSREPDVVLKFATRPTGTSSSDQESISFVAAYAPSSEGEIGINLADEAKRKGLEQCFVHTRELLNLPPGDFVGWPRVAIVMDRAATTLADVIERCRVGKLPVRVCSHIWRGLVECLRLLHCQHRKVHRDLKPANVMFQFDDGRVWNSDPASLSGARVLLADLATVVPRKADVKVCGTPDYMAPELFEVGADGQASKIVRGRHIAQPSDDLYALGRIAEDMAAVLDPASSNDWLTQLATRLKHRLPDQRPQQYLQLKLDGSPERLARKKFMEGGGFAPDRHQHFCGRQWVLDELREFSKRQKDQGTGGVFLVVAEAGMGKSALLTNWSGLSNLTKPETTPALPDEPAPSFYFRCVENRTSTDAMLQNLCRHLADRFELERDDTSRADAFEFRELIKQAADKLATGETLVIIVDALDEASDPQQVIQALPVELPAGVLLVVASRSAFRDGQDHLQGLTANTKYVRTQMIDPLGEHNIDDAVKFWKSEYRRLTDQSFDHVQTGTDEALNLVQNNNANFFILRSALDEMFPESGQPSLSLGDFRNQKRCRTVVDWHFEQWNRIIGSVGQPKAPLSSPEIAALVQFVKLLAAVQDVIEVDELVSILGSETLKVTERIDVNAVGELVKRTRWLLDRHDEPQVSGRHLTFIQRKHQSVLDFLTDPHGPAETGLHRMHETVARHYLDAASGEAQPDNRKWFQVNDYGLLYVVRHLLLSVKKHDRSMSNGVDGLELLRDQRWHEERLMRMATSD